MDETNNEGYTVEEALNAINGTPAPETTETEENTSEPQTTQEDPIAEVTEEVTEPAEEVVEPVAEPTPIDLNAKVKYKSNGADVDVSIQELINRAQLGDNYNTKMQELASQRKAFDIAMAQPKAAEVIDPAKQFEELNNTVTARAMQMLGIKDADEFVPDATGMIGNKTHYAAYQKAMLDVQQEQLQSDYSAREQRAVEDKYINAVNMLSSDPQFQEINSYAEKALFLLPQKGEEGIKEFQSIYATYQKIKERDQYHQEMHVYGRSNVTPRSFNNAEIDTLTKFYNDCKEEFSGSKVKEQVKAAVPKSVPIKPTVKTESTSSNEVQTPRKMDYKKIQTMDLADIAKLL